jgi:hypothetical protein
MTITKNSENTNAGKDVEKEVFLHTVGGKAGKYAHCGKQYGDLSRTRSKSTI